MMTVLLKRREKRGKGNLQKIMTEEQKIKIMRGGRWLRYPRQHPWVAPGGKDEREEPGGGGRERV